MQWEYRVKPFDPDAHDDWADKLNVLGREGWELVAISVQTENRWPQAIFKRPANSDRDTNAKVPVFGR